MTKKIHGGARPGAGRPAVADKRTIRGLAFNNAEWDLIRSKAADRGMSVREYICFLAEGDRGSAPGSR